MAQDSSNPLVQVTFRLSEAEAVAAWTRIGFNRRQQLLAAAMVLFFALAGAVAFAVREAALGYMLFMIGALLPVMRWIAFRKSCRRNYRGAPFMHGEITASFSDTGTRMTYPTGSSDTTWDGYSGWYDVEGIFVLMLTNTLTRMIPKKALNADQLQTLEALLQRKIVKKQP